MPSLFGTTPDYNRLLAVLRNEKPDRAPVYEFFSDTTIQMAAIAGDKIDTALPEGPISEWNEHIRAQYSLGYDYLSPWAGFNFNALSIKPAVDSEGRQRLFLDDHTAKIKTRQDFERFAWPKPSDVDYSGFEYCSKHLPEGMKLVGNLGGGLLEWGMWMLGAEHFCVTLYDDPDFIRDILARINEQQVAVASEAASHPDVIAIAMGDDMGFKTQTFIPPAALREYIFPGLKKIVDAVHAQGKPFILHSCGNLTEVMDDLIDYVKIDAKHSFEDVIMPVTEVQGRWGDRVALLGGVDVDKLCTFPEDKLRSYVRDIVLQCAPNGGYAVGSGNSIANYVPPRNLRVMLEEAVLCQN